MGDVREGQPWSAAQSVRNDLVYAVLSAAVEVVRRAPWQTRQFLGGWVGRLVGVCMPRARRRATQRLRAGFGGAPPVDAREVFEALGRDLADTLELLSPATQAGTRVRLEADGQQHLRDATALGRGVVFATVHHGLMEWMAAAVAEAGYDVWVVARESYDPRLTGLYERLRASRGVKTIYRGQPGAQARLLRALRAGGVVGFPMDFAGRGVAAVACPFLGETCDLPVGPARIALRTGAAVLAGAPVEAHGRWRVSTEPIDKPHADAPDADALLTQRMARALEARVLAAPAHWPWMHGSDAPTRGLPGVRERQYT